MLQVALNGGRVKAEHREVPITSAELARDALRCKRVGATQVHLHPRAAGGEETLDPEIVDATVAEVRSVSGLPVGVSTGAWIEPDPGRRAELVSRWTAPAYASVNVHEPGSVAVMTALTGAGIGIEAGVWSAGDAQLLAESGFATTVTRVLVEVHEPSAVGALRRAAQIHDALNTYGIMAPRLQHGVGEGAWILLRDAAERGIDSRVGLEDVLTSPRGGIARDNADLVDEAQAIIGRAMLRTVPARLAVPAPPPPRRFGMLPEMS